MSSVLVIGAGAFGTALANCFAAKGAPVHLWGRDAAQIDEMQRFRINQKRLPDVPLAASVTCVSDLPSGFDLAVLALPAQQSEHWLLNHTTHLQDCPLILTAKGLAGADAATQTDLAAATGLTQLAILSGPGFAAEIGAGKPTALTLGCTDAALGVQLQERLSVAGLRLYLCDDPLGVQLGGALKNVVALACGIAVGAGFGESARAALLTRGFAEMQRLAQAMGAKPETLTGLSGLGDLALTCGSAQSRNFREGLRIGKASAKSDSLTIEGIATATAATKLAARHSVEMPIAQAVADVLDGSITVTEALTSLLHQPLRKE